MHPPIVNAPATLPRVLGVPGAVLLGLGSMLGTGVFVSVGIAAGAAGPSILVGIALAGVLATFNALASAELAASHPVSGGTYEYGYRYLSPTLGFLAGFLFVAAKTASAATAALGLAGYVLSSFGASTPTNRVAFALGAVALLGGIVAQGMRRSSRTNNVFVSITLLGLGAFVAAGWPSLLDAGTSNLRPLLPEDADGVRRLLEGTALMFVAYTGYGRLATLGEEIRDPARSIPRAVIVTVLVTFVIYVAVAAVAVGVAGAEGLERVTRVSAAPLERVAEGFGTRKAERLVALAAVTAMVGVSLNLLLGVSRVLVAMARRGDVPRSLAALDGAEPSPRRAVLVTSLLIGALVSIGDVRATWSLSAFTVLAYYGITNLAALRLPAEHRRYPRAVPVAGLVGCALLAFFVDLAAWLTGLALLLVALVWHRAARALAARGGASP